MRDRRTDKESGSVLVKSGKPSEVSAEGVVRKDDYMADAMEPVPEEYTQKTLSESGLTPAAWRTCWPKVRSSSPNSQALVQARVPPRPATPRLGAGRFVKALVRWGPR
jgi:hypothetical protein